MSDEFFTEIRLGIIYLVIIEVLIVYFADVNNAQAHMACVRTTVITKPQTNMCGIAINSFHLGYYQT